MSFDIDISQINKAVQAIADQIGVAANLIVPEYTKYILAKSGFYIGFGAIFIVAAIILLIIGIRHYNDDYDGFSGIMIGGICFIFAGTLGAIGCYVFFLNLYNFVIWKISPTGAMVDQILQTLNH